MKATAGRREFGDRRQLTSCVGLEATEHYFPPVIIILWHQMVTCVDVNKKLKTHPPTFRFMPSTLTLADTFSSIFSTKLLIGETKTLMVGE